MQILIYYGPTPIAPDRPGNQLNWYRFDGVDYAAVSIALKRFEHAAEGSHRLRKCMDAATQLLIVETCPRDDYASDRPRPRSPAQGYRFIRICLELGRNLVEHTLDSEYGVCKCRKYSEAEDTCSSSI